MIEIKVSEYPLGRAFMTKADSCISNAISLIID